MAKKPLDVNNIQKKIKVLFDEVLCARLQRQKEVSALAVAQYLKTTGKA